MLIVNPTKYKGRFLTRAVELTKAGVRVGEVFVSGDDHFECHVCGHKNLPVEFEEGYSDAWVECAGCGVPFIVRDV